MRIILKKESSVVVLFAVVFLISVSLLAACNCGPTPTTTTPTTTTPTITTPTITTPTITTPTTTTPTTTTPTTTTPPTTTTTPTTTTIVWSPDMDCGATCHVMQSYVDSLKNTSLSAYAHAQLGYVCLDCHELAVLEEVHKDADLSATKLKERKFPMDFCFKCHKSYPTLIELTEDYTSPLGAKINPHDTHQGELECYTCHKVHKESPGINYCYSCHHSGTFVSCSECHQ